MSASGLSETVFHDWHAAHGARLIEFGGWHMAVQYSTIVEEHHAVRRAGGLFDVAHMGRLKLTGPDACHFLDHVLTNDVSALKVGQVRYALVVNEHGFTLDDVLVSRLEDSYLLVVNASNRPKISAWLEQHRGGFEVTIDDLSDQHAMLAIQGPASVQVMSLLGAESSLALKYYSAHTTSIRNQTAIVSRTGYTGEDGFEIILPNSEAVPLWEQILSVGQSLGVVPCGLGCRDTLRLEAAMPLYGHELNESIDPLTAGLGFAVKLTKPDFIGKAALQAIQQQAPARRRVGLQLASRRIAREGASVLSAGTIVGEVTSGTFSPTLEKSIAMAYVAIPHAAVGTALTIDIRGKSEDAVVVDLPFYRRAK